MYIVMGGIGHGHNLGYDISHRAHRVRREKSKAYFCDLPPGRKPYGPEAAGSARY